jgi:hypothetical protein
MGISRVCNTVRGIVLYFLSLRKTIRIPQHQMYIPNLAPSSTHNRFCPNKCEDLVINRVWHTHISCWSEAKYRRSTHSNNAAAVNFLLSILSLTVIPSPGVISPTIPSPANQNTFHSPRSSLRLKIPDLYTESNSKIINRHPTLVCVSLIQCCSSVNPF